MRVRHWLLYQRFMWPKRRALLVLRLHTTYRKLRELTAAKLAAIIERAPT